MNAIEDLAGESIRIARTQERVGAMMRPMEQMLEMVNEILADAPELGPEMGAVLARVSECCDHLSAALAVIQAKVDLL